MIQANINLLQHFPPKTPQELKETIAYIEAAPLAENHWQILKGLYKKAEKALLIEVLIPLIEKIDKTNTLGLNSPYPKAPTVGYMKRRAARFLRELAGKDEQKYVQICQALLQTQTNSFNYAQQWVVADILLHDSHRYHHNRNGRGNIIQLCNKPNIARSEAFACTIWDTHLSVIKTILTTPSLALEVYDFAVKTLMRNHQPIPLLTDQQLLEFFHSQAPWLKKVAIQQVFQHLNGGQKVKELLWAQAYFYAPGDLQKQFLVFWKKIIEQPNHSSKLRQTFLELLGKEENQVETTSFDQSEFVKHLATVTVERFAHTDQITRRIQHSLPLIINYIEVITYGFWLKHATTIFEMKQEALISELLNAIQKSSVKDIPKWLQAVPDDQTELLKRVQEICLKRIPANFNREQLERWLFSYNPVTAHFGWKVVAKHNKAKGITQTLWGRLYYHNWSHTPLQSMLCSEDGSHLFLTYCPDRIRWISWYKSTVIQIVQQAHPRVQTKFRTLLQDWVKNDIWNWLPLLEQLADRDEFLTTIGSQKKLLQRLSWRFFDVLTHSSDWVKQTIWRWVEKEQIYLNQDWANELTYGLIDRLNQEQGQQFIQDIQQHTNRFLKEAIIKGVGDALNKDPHLINKVVAVIGTVLQNLTPETVIQCTISLQQDKWEAFEKHLFQYCRKETGTGFWKALLKLIPEQEEDSILIVRTLNKEAIAATFYQLTDASILEEQHPALGELLFGWVQKQASLFTPNSNLLYQALVHKVTPIRQWANARTKTTEMAMSFALRLMESDMPSAYTLGQRFFEEVPKGKEEELSYVLALCDSPNETVRAFGIQFLQERKESFHNDIALQFLSEHTDPIVQAFVAEQLIQETPDDTFVKQFDESVLRTKNSSRKAKEFVKKRVAHTLHIDPQTLLNIARGKGQGDKEWAIHQLTKLVLSGVDIEDFALNE